MDFGTRLNLYISAYLIPVQVEWTYKLKLSNLDRGTSSDNIFFLMRNLYESEY